MASRRMFSLKIIDSAKFLKMPTSTRLLYFDLCMRADDDGVVEGFNVLRMTGATEDDLRVLVAKDFIRVLNDDLVAYITDWKEHNKIRADRKVDSIYKDLLLQVLPDVKLLEPRKRADLKRKNETKNNVDVQLTDNGQHSIGKDSIGKDSIGKDSIVKTSIEECCCDGDFNILKYAEMRNFILSAMQVQQVMEDINIYSWEEVKKALDIADDNGKHTYSYVKGILERRRAGTKEKSKNETEFERIRREAAERGEDPF